MSSSATRRRAEQRGRLAEARAALRLRLAGFRILARRARVPGGEIDLVARRGRLLIFVEVKARRRAEEALEAITPRQRDRITRAAAAFCAGRPDLAICRQRFDVMSLGEGRFAWPRWLRDAWRL